MEAAQSCGGSGRREGRRAAEKAEKEQEEAMAVTFTPEQKQVIELRDRNILVSAAAGSGKTAVLVERIIRMITDEAHPVDIDRLLVVTFTNAAAAEMRERISLAISRKLEETPENVHLQKQASLLHNAQITTIDSFCLFLIRNNFNDIGLDPGFRVADEGELKLLKQDVMAELLEEQFAQRRETFTDCVEYFTGGSSDKLLEEYIAKLYEFSMSHPWPEDWIRDCGKDYKITNVAEMEEADWCRYLVEHMKVICRQCAADLDAALAICDRPDGPYMYGQTLADEREMLELLLKPDSLQGFYEAVGKVSFGRLPSKKDDTVNPLWRERVQQIRKEIKKQLERLKTDYLAFSPEQAAAKMEAASKGVEELLHLVLCFKEKLDAAKRRENMIDFHDMEHFALNILLRKDQQGNVTATDAAREYRQHFYEILIDEYQDSNLVQELLLKSISGEEDGNCNRFMVGDVKQSIYKFRLARPELFMEKYNCYEIADPQSQHHPERQRIDLRKNFRSRRQVLSSVNDLFYQIMGEDLGGVSYDADAALYEGAVYPETEASKKAPEGVEEEAGFDPYETEYLIIEKDDTSELSVREQEASAIAGKIRKLRTSLQVTDKESGSLRPVRYSDMVILLRTTANWAEEFKSTLEKEGIPAYVASRTGYFQAVEIKVLMQLLHVIDNPLQDIPLYGTMKSFFGGFSEEEIARIRSKDLHVSLYELLKDFGGNEQREVTEQEQQLREKVQRFLSWLDTYRQKTSYTPIHKLIQEILRDTGYLDYVTARLGGEQRRANVEMLLTRASAFEHTSYYGLFHFLRYVEHLEKYEVDYGEADVLDENADVVRIMSIHKSKGLEFPVCFVAGLSKKFNMQDTTGRLIADADMGVGVDYIDPQLRMQSSTLKKNAVALKMRKDALGEELRVLYVAMTRAKEKLILTGMCADAEKLKERLKQQGEERKERTGNGKEETGNGAAMWKKVPFSVLFGAGSYLDFLLPCAEQIQILTPQLQFAQTVQEAAGEHQRKEKLLLGAGRGSDLTEAEKQIMTELSDKFNRTYPYRYLSELYIKTTVSELKKKGMQNLTGAPAVLETGGQQRGAQAEHAFTRQLFEEPEVVPYIPSFMKKEEGMSGTDRGSAYHKVMELLDLTGLTGRKGQERRAALSEQLDHMVAQELLSSEWRESIFLPKVETFLDSRLAERMAQAQKKGMLKREQPFVLGLSADRLDSGFPKEEQVLIQGIIDVFFEEDGSIVVADYKTDVIKTDEELTARYRVQLDYYAEALSRLTGKKVSQKILYSFALGREIVLY